MGMFDMLSTSKSGFFGDIFTTIMKKGLKGLFKGLMAKLGNFDYRYGLRGAPSDMNQGGIVQAFGKGGAISGA